MNEALLAPLRPLSAGEPAPEFVAATRQNPRYAFTVAAGRYVLLGFMPEPGAAREAMRAAIEANLGLFDAYNRAAFLLTRESLETSAERDHLPGVRWMFDPQGEVGALYGASAEGLWLLLDPLLRVVARWPAAEVDQALAAVRGSPGAGDYAGVELVAPVLIVPRIFEPELCRRLIDHYEAQGGQPSGVMRQVGGRTVGVLDNSKRRKDADIDDEGFRGELRVRLARRLAPQIERAFRFKPTRIERFIVACYDAEDRGFFAPHRDNTTLGTAHRQFAVSINLNAEEFEGGDLRFPEFGPRTYRPPTGGAVVFGCSLMHEATPVTRGRRYAFLPFLYDEAGARIREANRGSLADAGTDNQ